MSYHNFHAEINSDTISALFKLGLKQQYHSYKLNISKRYYKGNVGIGYSINHAEELFHNYNFYLNRRIFRYFQLEYRYVVETKPTQFDLKYEDFNYSAINNQNHKSSRILYSFKKNKIENNIQYDRINYSKITDNNFDSFKGGKRKTFVDLLVHPNKKVDFYFDFESSLDTMMIDLLKNESIFFKINIFKNKTNSYSLKMNYKLIKSSFTFGLNHKNYQYELSSRINIQDISDNLVEIFTVPIINGLDTIKILQDNIFLFYNREMNNSKYKIGVNFSKNSIYYYLRAGTPPLNPLIPIFIVKKGDYTLNMMNLILSYSFIINNFHIDILLDNMSPISISNKIDVTKGSIIDDVPLGYRFILFNQLNIRLVYPLN